MQPNNTVDADIQLKNNYSVRTNEQYIFIYGRALAIEYT